MSEVNVLSLLQTLDGGRVLDDLHERLSELLLAVETAHKKGKVVLTFTVKPVNDPEAPRVDLKGDVTHRIPTIERHSELFYLTESYRLTRKHPRQPSLPENTVKMPPAEERDDLDRQSLAAGEKA